MSTQYILVCPDTYEFIYPSMLYSNVQQATLANDLRDVEGLVGMSQFTLGAKAMGLLAISPKAADQNGGPIQEPVNGVVGRWFNKRIAVLTSGKLYNKLRDQAEGEISAARLAALAPVKSADEFSADDFLVDGILDALVEPIVEEDEIEEDEETVEDKEEFIPKEQEYVNISGLMRDYLVKTGQAMDDGLVGDQAEVRVVLRTKHCKEKIRIIKALRETRLPEVAGLTEAKIFFEEAEVVPKTLVFPATSASSQAQKFADFASAYDCDVTVEVIANHPATVRPVPEPKMKAKAVKATSKTPKAEDVPDLAAIVDAAVV